MYTNQLEKIHWFRVDERKPHKDGGAGACSAPGPTLPAESGLRTKGSGSGGSTGSSGPGPTGPEGLICGLL